MKNNFTIQNVQATLISVSMSNVSAAAYTDFEAAALKVIEELKEEDNPSKGADTNVSSS